MGLDFSQPHTDIVAGPEKSLDFYIFTLVIFPLHYVHAELSYIWVINQVSESGKKMHVNR